MKITLNKLNSSGLKSLTCWIIFLPLKRNRGS